MSHLIKLINWKGVINIMKNKFSFYSHAWVYYLCTLLLNKPKMQSEVSIQSFSLTEIKSWIRMTNQRNRASNKQGIRRKTSEMKPGPATCFLLENQRSSMKSQSFVHVVKILPREYYNHFKIRKTSWCSGICAYLGGNAWFLTLHSLWWSSRGKDWGGFSSGWTEVPKDGVQRAARFQE